MSSYNPCPWVWVGLVGMKGDYAHDYITKWDKALKNATKQRALDSWLLKFIKGNHLPKENLIQPGTYAPIAEDTYAIH